MNLAKSLVSKNLKQFNLNNQMQAHHQYVTLVANPREGQTVAPFTQVAWRDDCSMQLEAVSDQFLDYFLDAK